jgi:PAS domain S-box-containing protein
VRDLGGELVYANRAALENLGFDSLDELRRSPTPEIMADYIVEDEHGRPLAHDDVPSVRLMRGERVEPVLMRVVNRTTGEERWSLLRATALRNRRGTLLGAMTVIEDMTAVKIAEIRTRVLADSGRLLTSSLDYQTTLRNVAEVAVPQLADYCGLDLLDGHGGLQRVAAVHRDPARRETADRLGALGRTELEPTHPGHRVLLTNISELFHEISDEDIASAARDEEHLGLLQSLGLRSLLMVPLRVPGRTIGLMTLGTDRFRRRLVHDDVELAEQLGRRIAVAVENARLHTKLTDVAETLQQSLLPDPVPDVPGWDVAALYRPAETELRIDVGGDFYEFFEHDGTWFAIIGDVAGKGVTAASMTTLMRHGARVASRAEPSPAAILARLDEALADQPGDAMASALCLRLFEDRLVLSSAGHPPAIIIAADGTLREVPAPGPLLGAFADSSWPEQEVPIAAGDLVVAYTDGVTDRRGSDGRFGIARLRGLLSAQPGSTPDQLLERLKRELDQFSSGVGSDDVAALALRLKPPE